MADQLYLSLWFPNFRFSDLPDKLVCVLEQFVRVGGSSRVNATAAVPLSWSEPPIFQRIFVNDDRSEHSDDALPHNAVAEVTQQLHEDTVYEIEAQWQLWHPQPELQGLEPTWHLQPSIIKTLGFGPNFDESTYEQNGHIRVDFGLDAPWVQDESEIDNTGRRFLQQNIEKLLAFTLSVEKHCGVSSRLLWTESGEALAEKLLNRLQRLT